MAKLLIATPLPKRLFQRTCIEQSAWENGFEQVNVVAMGDYTVNDLWKKVRDTDVVLVSTMLSPAPSPFLDELMWLSQLACSEYRMAFVYPTLAPIKGFQIEDAKALSDVFDRVGMLDFDRVDESLREAVLYLTENYAGDSII